MANLENNPIVQLPRCGTVGQPGQISVKALALSVLAATATVPHAKYAGTGPSSAPPLAGREREPQSKAPLAACGSSHCAGCYHLGDGRKIHPPKSSAEWLARLEHWKPKGSVQ
jgi:hypothetical protein